MKKHIITALAVSALIAGAATTAEATGHYTPRCDTFARYVFNPFSEFTNSTPLTDPAHWQVTNKRYDGSPTGVVIHRGSGNGSYFYWAPTAPCPDPDPSGSPDPQLTVSPSPSPEPTTTVSPSPDPTITPDPDPEQCPPGTVPGAPDEDGNFICQNDEPVVELHDESSAPAPAARAVTSNPTFTG